MTATDLPAPGRLPTGAPGELLLSHRAPGGGRLTLRVLDPTRTSTCCTPG